MILKALQDYLQTYEGMNLQPLATDLAGTVISKYALAPSGNGKTTTDIVGNKTFENNYVFYAKEYAADESERKENHDFLEGFSDWLDEQNDANNFPVLTGGYGVDNIAVSNAMLMDIGEDGNGLYQIQIKLTITKKKG